MSGAYNDDESSRVCAARWDVPRINGGPRSRGAITARVLRSIPTAARSQSSTTSTTKSLLGRCGVLVTTAATFVMTVVLWTSNMTPGVSTTTLFPVGGQSLYVSRGRRHSISIVGAGRALQEEEDTAVIYETELQLFLCNPSLVEEGNDAYLVDNESVAMALSRILVLGQSDPDDIEVTIKTGPLGTGDDAYMCDTDGMLQWHAKIHYGADDAVALETTPVVMAAKANDFVAYSSSDFKILLSAFINDEYTTNAQAVDVSAEDIVVSNVGWTVTFPSQAPSVREGETTGSLFDFEIGVMGDAGLWNWWVWLVFALLLACFMAPVCCCCLWRRRGDTSATKEVLDTTRDGCKRGDSPEEVRDPEWGPNELGLKEGHNHLRNENEEKRGHGHGNLHGGRGVEPASHPASNRPGRLSGRALIQETGEQSTWAQRRSSSRSPLPLRSKRRPIARHLDIQGEDNDGGDRGMATSRGKPRQYSPDKRLRSGRHAQPY